MKDSQPKPTAKDDGQAKARREDADIPAGDMPPKPVWPLAVGVAAWVLWIGFLAVMMVIRQQTTAV